MNNRVTPVTAIDMLRGNLKLHFLITLICCLNELSFAQATDDVRTDKITNDTTLFKQRLHTKMKRYTAPPFNYPGRGWFLQGEVVTGFLNFGAKIVAGYRLGQFGIIGGGIGAEGPGGIQTLTLAPFSDPYASGYFPIVFHYEGDLLRKKVLPFYAIEAGYGARYTDTSANNYVVITGMSHPVYKYLGGFRGAFDFGVKIYTYRRVYVNVATAFDVQQASDKYSNYYYNSIGQDIKVSYSSSIFLYSATFKVTVGFLGRKKEKRQNSE